MEYTPLISDQPRVGTIEMALNALVSVKPKAGEKTHSFVRRCCAVVAGNAQRGQLFDAIMLSLNELSLTAMTPASIMQDVLNATAPVEGGAQ